MQKYSYYKENTQIKASAANLTKIT